MGGVTPGMWRNTSQDATYEVVSHYLYNIETKKLMFIPRRTTIFQRTHGFYSTFTQ
jgi:hypothetical protein